MKYSVIEKLAAVYAGGSSAGSSKKESDKKAVAARDASGKAYLRRRKAREDKKAMEARDRSGAAYLKKRRAKSFAARRRDMGDVEWHRRNAAWAKRHNREYKPRGRNLAGYDKFLASRTGPKGKASVPIVDPNSGRVFSHRERELQMSLPKKYRGPSWKQTHRKGERPGERKGALLKQPTDKAYWAGKMDAPS